MDKTIMQVDPSGYKDGSSSTAMVPRVMRRVLDYFQPGEIDKMFDIGCGPGHTTAILNDGLKPKQIIGVDLDKDMIEYANSSNSNIGNFYVVDFTKNIEENEHFDDFKDCDLVVSTFCYHLMHFKLEAAVMNTAKLLKKGGRCVISPIMWSDYFSYYGHFLRSPEGSKYMDVDSLPDNVMVKLPFILPDAPSRTEYMDLWLDLLQKAGLEMEEFSIVHEIRDFPPGMIDLLETGIFLTQYVQKGDKKEFGKKFRDYVAQRVGYVKGQSFKAMIETAIIVATKL